MVFYPQKEINPQTSYAISVFNKGDIITRLEPANGDSSYRGERLIYKGIKNNQIIFIHPMFHKACTLSLERWQHGWGLYKPIED